MLGVGRLEPSSGPSWEAFCSVWAGGFQIIMGVLIGARGSRCYRVPLKDPQA
jgi:hypothetical protein